MASMRRFWWLRTMKRHTCWIGYATIGRSGPTRGTGTALPPLRASTSRARMAMACASSNRSG